MKKRNRILLVGLLVVILGILAWLAIPAHFPPLLFHGKPENDWIQNLVYRDDQQVVQWREFGPDGVQVLIRALANANHPLERAYRKAYRGMLPLSGHLLPAPQMDTSRATRMAVVDLLSRLSKDARLATPVMAKELNDEDSAVRAIALTFFTQGEDQNTLLNLMDVKEKRKLLPKIIGCMQDSEWSVRNNAVLALGYFPEQAQLVTPVLVKALQDPVPQVRKVAAKALKKIDPEAAAKAGIK